MKRKRNICAAKRMRENMASSGRHNLKKKVINNNNNRIYVQRDYTQGK